MGANHRLQGGARRRVRRGPVAGACGQDEEQILGCQTGRCMVTKRVSVRVVDFSCRLFNKKWDFKGRC